MDANSTSLPGTDLIGTFLPASGGIPWRNWSQIQQDRIMFGAGVYASGVREVVLLILFGKLYVFPK